MRCSVCIWSALQWFCLGGVLTEARGQTARGATAALYRSPEMAGSGKWRAAQRQRNRMGLVPPGGCRAYHCALVEEMLGGYWEDFFGAAAAQMGQIRRRLEILVPRALRMLPNPADSALHPRLSCNQTHSQCKEHDHKQQQQLQGNTQTHTRACVPVLSHPPPPCRSPPQGRRCPTTPWGTVTK